jgi:hypothetical protein
VGSQGNIGQALGAGFGCGGLRALELRDQVVCRENDQEVHDCGGNEERDDGIDEVAVGDWRPVETEGETAEVRLAMNCADQLADDVLAEGSNDCIECGADHDCDSEIDHIAAKNKIAKAFEHVSVSRRVRLLARSTVSIRQAGEESGGVLKPGWLGLLRGDPVGVGVEEQEEDHAECHEVHVDEEDDSSVVPAPTGTHAAEMIDQAGDRGEGEERDPGVLPALREAGEQDGDAEADEDEDASTQEGPVPPIEVAVHQRTED